MRIRYARRRRGHERPQGSRQVNLKELIDAGAIFYISHSGGKDSQAMYAVVSRQVPQDQVVVVHADLGHVEWPGTLDHIRSNISQELHVVRAGKSFLEMVRDRARKNPRVPCWPSPRYRQCTSDLKRSPIERFIRQDLRRRGLSLAVSCIGLRAGESSVRSRKLPWSVHSRLSVAGRIVYEWLPVHELTEKEVFDTICAFGQRPFWIYTDPSVPNRRKSCVFCIMGCWDDLVNGAIYHPELLDQISGVEDDTGWTFFAGESLADRIARHQRQKR